MKAALWLAALLLVRPGVACTIVTATAGDTVFFAANEDQPPNKAWLVTDKTGRYGVVFLATPTDDAPLVLQMGINEQGLSYDINAISDEPLARVPGAVRQDEWALVQLMREVGTVAELLERLFRYDWGRSIAYQIHVADRSGDAAVIHPGYDGRLTFTRIDRSKGHLVSTNFNQRDEKRKKWLSPRHRAAEARFDSLAGAPTAAFMASVLAATRQAPGWISNVRTLFSVVFNLQTLDIDLYDDGRFDKPYRLNVRSVLAQAAGRQTTPLPEVLEPLDPARKKGGLQAAP